MSVLGASLDADLQIIGVGKRLTLATLRNVRDVEGVREARPVIEGSATLRGPRGLDATVNVQAIDTLQSFPGSNAARRYDPGPFAPPSPLDYALTRGRGIVLSQPLAARLALARGSAVDALVRGTPVALKVVLIVPARTVGLDANTILVDIATASKVLGADRTLDRIDVVTDGAPLEAVMRRIGRVLPREARVVRSAERIESLERLTDGFRSNMRILAYMALALGAILVANSVGISVRRRRPEIAILRSLGVARARIARAFVSEGALLGALGGTVGALLGYAFALALSGYGDPASLLESGSQVAADTATLARGIGIGLILSIVAATAPALEAASVLPATALQAVSRRRPGATSLAASGTALTLASVAAAFVSTTGSRASSASAAAIGYLIGIGLCVPFLFSNAIALGSRFAASFSVPGRLAIARLRANEARLHLAIITLVISVCASVSVATATASFAKTVHGWALRDMPGDLEIRPIGVFRADPTDALRERIARVPGVAQILPVTATDTAALAHAAAGSLFVVAKSSVALESLRRALISAASPVAIDVRTSRDARAADEALFERSLSLATDVGRVSVIIAIGSTVATILALVTEQGRELVLLRIIGLALAPMRQMIVYEAFALTAFGASLGVAAGLVLGATIVLSIDPHVTGYSEKYVAPLATAIATPLLAVVVAMLSAAIVARLASGRYAARRATGLAALHADE